MKNLLKNLGLLGFSAIVAIGSLGAMNHFLVNNQGSFHEAAMSYQQTPSEVYQKQLIAIGEKDAKKESKNDVASEKGKTAAK